MHVNAMHIPVPWRSVHPQTTMRQFDPHYPSTQQTVCCDKLPLWHSDTYMNRPGIFCPPPPPGSGWSVCNWWHDIHPPQNALWHHLHPFLKRNLDGLSHDSWTHLWCPAGCLAKCGCFVTGFFSTRLRCPAGFSGKCGCRMISGPICDVMLPAQRNVDVMSQDFFTCLCVCLCVCVCVRVHQSMNQCLLCPNLT